MTTRKTCKNSILLFLFIFLYIYGGEGGIRTHVELAPPTDFESVFPPFSISLINQTIILYLFVY